MRTAVAAVGLVGVWFSTAQTFSSCNPVRGDVCSPVPAFGDEASMDFSTPAQLADIESIFKIDDGIKYDEEYDQVLFGTQGMNVSIFRERHAPTLYSHNYLFFGRVEVELRAAPGPGIITSVVLQSDTLDEIDWEWVGNDQKSVQTNIFSQGIKNHNHGGRHDLAVNAVDNFHTYTIDWTPTKITWSIDGVVVREALPDAGVFPQTPCQVRIGTWVGGKGDPNGKDKGRIDWAGGLAQWDMAPFSAYYRRIRIVDNAGGHEFATAYEYVDGTGRWESIRVIGSDPRSRYTSSVSGVFSSYVSEMPSHSSSTQSSPSLVQASLTTPSSFTSSHFFAPSSSGFVDAVFIDETHVSETNRIDTSSAASSSAIVAGASERTTNANAGTPDSSEPSIYTASYMPPSLSGNNTRRWGFWTSSTFVSHILETTTASEATPYPKDKDRNTELISVSAGPSRINRLADANPLIGALSVLILM